VLSFEIFPFAPIFPPSVNQLAEAIIPLFPLKIMRPLPAFPRKAVPSILNPKDCPP
jgi:hypothetical protein